MAGKAPTLAEVEDESVQDSILKSMAEVVGEPLDETPAEPAADTEKSQSAAPADSTRDERGRFKAKAAEEAAAEVADTAQVEDEATGAAPADGEPAPIDPPVEWKADEQEQFRVLPRKTQEFVLARHQMVKDAETRLAQTAGKYAPLEQLLAPRRAALARDGLDEIGYIQQLDRLSQSAAQDPVGFVRWFAQQRGIRPEQLFAQQRQQPQGQPQPADPYISNLENRLGRFESWMQQQARGAEEATQRELVNQISTFGTAADANGKLQHPYFEEVRVHMGALLRSDLVPDLQSAYDMACRAHPEVSRKIDQAAKAKADQDRQADARKKAVAARNAGSSISGTPGDRSAPPPSGDVREDLRRQFAERGLL